jgi:hypothetical protein
MNLKLYMAIVETRRHVQESLLPVFDEIAQTCVKIAQGRRGAGNPFSSLQSYLDGRIIVGDVSYQRRSLLLAVHDMAQDKEAPLALRRKALAQLIALQMNPIPKLTLYRDVATAILRMEVVMRLSAAQAPKERKREPILASASLSYWEDLRQWGQSSADAMSASLAGLQTALLEIHAPRMPSLTFSALRYQFASSLRAVISI